MSCPRGGSCNFLGTPSTELALNRQRQIHKSAGAATQEPMAWALRASDRSIVHISKVTVTGRGCACVCAGCGAGLDAVNADKPPEHFLEPNTLRKSFRHPPGSQRGDCLRRATQAAVFQTMLDRKTLVLPARQIRRTYEGVSGHPHPGDASNDATVRAIEGILWSDSVGALLRLAGGRVVHLVLRADVAIDPRGNAADAVLVVTADDPEVASWAPEEILARAQLVEGWCRWERHWDDEALGAQAAANAREEALQRLDELPADPAVNGDEVSESDGPFGSPAFLEGLTDIQRGETLLHLHLKRLLASLSLLEVGTMEFSVTYAPGGSAPPLRGAVAMPGLRLRLFDVRLEQRLGNIVPDVLCHAEDFSGELESTDLVVEVAVTHFVGLDKLAKIQALDVACLEFDARRLGASTGLTLDGLRQLLQHPPAGAVRWLHHPHLRMLADDMRKALRVKSEALAAEQEAAARRRREADRLEAQRQASAEQHRKKVRALASRVQVMDRRTLLRAYFEEAVQRRPVFDHHEWSDDIADVFRSGFMRHKLDRWASPILQDVMVALHSVRQVGQQPDRSDIKASVMSSLDRAMKVDRHRLRPYLPLLLKAIKIHWTSGVDDSQRTTLRSVAHEVKASIDEGQQIFAREPALDEPLRIVFPELRDLLVIGARGTLAYANDIGAELTATRQRIAAERGALRVQQAEEAAVAHASAVEAALTPARPRQWTRGGGVPFEKWSMYAKACELAGYEFTLIRQAYEARENNQPVEEFVRAKRITTEAGVRSCLSALNKVYLLS
jgi:hypothetical protein